MQFEADLIKLLQRASNGFTDAVFLGISQLGTELAFLAIAVVLYWVLDKRYAYRFFNVYILGVAITNFLKLGFKRTRPFNAYDVRSIGDPEPTYSFPSGHTESIASISTLLTIKYGQKSKAVPIVCIAATLLVMLSRMYLGQHYLSDVFCGLTVGVFCAIAFNALLSLFGDKEELFIIPNIIVSVIIISVLAGVGMLNSPSGADILKGLGAFVAFDIGYFVEKRYVKYDVASNRLWWTVALRLVVGLGVAVGIQQGFKLFLPQSIPMLYCFLRYFLMAAWAALAAPALFKKLKI
ncbi:MAG: phosphatase PAP2 family protein [Clostridiales bacterium]|nr:phosphatase PAP2 family protein [Clostridiales bacterium]MDE6618872.1 phosphatase PAP2 family protein [Clostridiales bacterium]